MPKMVNITKIGKFINLAEIESKCKMHYWLRGWTPLQASLAVPTPNTIHHSRLTVCLTFWILTAASQFCLVKRL